MSSLLSSPEPVRLPALPAPVADPGYLKVVVAFDDQAAYRRALKWCVRVRSELEEGLRVQPLPWTPDYLGRSDWPPISPRQAAEADIAPEHLRELPVGRDLALRAPRASPRRAAGG